MNQNSCCAVSIATCSYLPKAFVAMESFLAHNPDCDGAILVADLSADAVRRQTWPLADHVTMFGLDALSDTRVMQMHDYFNALEFCCAAKPFVADEAINAWGYECAVLLDPDTITYSTLEPVWNVLEASALVLTPHVNAPMPEDGYLPDDRELAVAGFANAGLWAVRKSGGAHKALAWMKDRLTHYGFFSPADGLYADQNWLSSLPWYYPDDVGVLRHPGVNVAYWNLHERHIQEDRDTYSVNGKPLVLLHLSGYQESRPQRLTTHPCRPLDGDNARVLDAILANYHQRLLTWRKRLPKQIPDRPCFEGALSQRVARYRSAWGQSSRFRRSGAHASTLIRVRRFVGRALRCLQGAAAR